jgi:hypothetical protein
MAAIATTSSIFAAHPKIPQNKPAGNFFSLHLMRAAACRALAGATGEYKRIIQDTRNSNSF